VTAVSSSVDGLGVPTAARRVPDASVLVVGAGPAGSVAALVLAKAGVSVKLVDRASFPRDKLCGDTLNPGTLAIVERLGLRAAVDACARPFTGMVLTGPRGANVTADYPDGLAGAAVTRRDFDNLLLNAAIVAGADFVPGVHVAGPFMDATGARVSGVRIGDQSGREPIRARIVIAADGRHSKLAFALGLARFASRPKRWAFGAYFTDVDGLSERGEMHVGLDAYTGVAPLSAGLANVCVVRELNHAGPGSHMNGEETIANALRSNPVLRERFVRARRVSPVASLGPLAVDTTDAGCPGLLLAGDAAGFIDPMTGDGMRFALRGGELAAEAALAELEGHTPAHEHLRLARTREFTGKWRFNRALRTLVGSRGGLALAESIGAWWPEPLRLVVRVAGDVRLAGQPTPRS
jgi:flavin-dependent dehydrogenase